MAATFISYSRKDTDFVRRIHDALVARNHETWVDWEGIPPSAEWMREIVVAIDAATAFVFVMTPASLASKVCQEELAHALGQNKRLIPIAPCDLEAAVVPEALSRLNWIQLRARDDFEQGLCALSPDSRFLATSGAEEVRVWELASRVEVARLEQSGVGGLLFSRAGRFLATFDGGSVRVWALQLADLIELSCARLTENMDPEAWRGYFEDERVRPTCPPRGSQ
ncbi:MAG TPA: TIR domain-containing protein [Polyangiaceae bacterium]|nr:TIR domain-containing protein [Polyangiaceae bacterium]